MTYANRRIWDADSHLMETPDWLVSDARTSIRGRIRENSWTCRSIGKLIFLQDRNRAPLSAAGRIPMR